MSSFEAPMSWMKQVFTKKELDEIKKEADKLRDNEKKQGKKVDQHKYEILRDKIIEKMHNSELGLPFGTTTPGGVLEHLKRIKKNLFITYPFYFDGDQLTSLEESTKKAGFNIRVDPYASRGVGVNLRVVIWKPIKKNAKK